MEMTTPRYTFRVNPGRYREVYDKLESFEDGERSFWILQALLEKLESERNQVNQPKQAINQTFIEEPILAPPPPPTRADAADEIEQKNEAESKLDQLARLF
jgi:hypothetical protein